MVATDGSNPPSEGHTVIHELIHGVHSTTELTQYRSCLEAVLTIAPTERPRLLASAIKQFRRIAQAVPWAMDDWCGYYPALSDLPLAARLVPDYDVPPTGVTDYPVIAALRRHSLRAYLYDDHARALLISLAVRIDTDHRQTHLKRSKKQASYPCIKHLSRRIGGLNRQDSRKHRGPWFQQAAEKSDSPESYLIALARACLNAEKRDDDLCEALGNSAMTLFGLPALSLDRPRVPGPTAPVNPGSIEPYPDDTQQSVRERVEVRNITIPTDDSDDNSPEARDEDCQTLFFVRQQRPRRKPFDFRDLRAIIQGQIRAQNISSAGELFLTTHIDALLTVSY